MISAQEKARIKELVEKAGYLSEDGIMDVADAIVPGYGECLVEQDEAGADRHYRKWKLAFNLTWDYVEYLEARSRFEALADPLA
jgi:hypothetical protein